MGRYNRYYTDYSSTNPEPPVANENDEPVVNSAPAEEPTNVEEEAVTPESEKVEEAPAPAPVQQNAKGKVVNCEMVNVRSAADTSSSILFAIQKDAEVEITSMQDPDYYAVNVLGTNGFIKRDFIQVI